jgi:glutamate synthase (NADPH/NADH) small chain
MRYGIPSFKMEKSVLDRRLEQMRAEGTQFRTGVDVGATSRSTSCASSTTRCCWPAARRWAGTCRSRAGTWPASTWRWSTSSLQPGAGGRPAGAADHAQGKDVIIIGGGDTGADCLGTAIRQGARSITQLEIMPRPPQERPDTTPGRPGR